MPIGVNYTGFDGRTVSGSLPSLRGSGPDLKGSLGSLRGALTSVRDAKRTGSQFVGGSGGFAQTGNHFTGTGGGFAQPKVAAGASIRNGATGLKLDGDERNTQNVRNGSGFYGKVNGRRTWLGLDDIDPRNNGGIVGDATSNDAEAQQDIRDATDTAPFTDSSITRIVFQKVDAKEDEESGEITEHGYTNVWAFYRERHISGEGRTFEVTGERKVFVGRISDDEAEELDVVTDVRLDDSGTNPRLMQKKRKILAVVASEETDSEVFEATPHVAHDGY